MRVQSLLLFLPAISIGCSRSSLDSELVAPAAEAPGTGGTGPISGGESPEAGVGGPDGANDGAIADEGGAVSCPEGQASCSNSCVVLTNDNGHCGSCNIACPDGESCVGGLCQGGASIWPTLGGDIHHTGYNPNETGTPPLTVAWSTPLVAAPLSPAVSDGTAIYVTGETNVWALSPSTGGTLWLQALGAQFSVGQPSVDTGHVYVSQCDEINGTYMDALVASTGQIEWSQKFASQWSTYWAPLVVGGRVDFNGGQYGGLYSLDQGTGAQEWIAGEEQYDEWSPMFLDDRIYSFTDGNIRMFYPEGGGLITVAAVQWNWHGYDMKTSAVSDGTSVFVIAPPNISAFSADLSAPVWTVAGNYESQPAVANGVLYALFSNTSFSGAGQASLSALSAASGAVMWSFAGDANLSYPPVIAGHYVYVASDENVYAVDTRTQEQVWAATPGGWLSIANGQLYVARADGTLDAWDMTP